MRITLLAALSAIAVLAVGLAPAAAADKAKDLIVGKWKLATENAKAPELEFTKDGKVKISRGGETADGTYKFTDDDTIEVSLEFNGEKHEAKLTVKKINKDEMVLIESKQQKEDTFKRVK